MKNSKGFLIFGILLLLLLIVLMGCPSRDSTITPENDPPSKKVGLLMTADANDPLGAAVEKGLDRALESQGGELVSALVTGEEYETGLREFGDRGIEVIWVVGGGLAAPLAKVAPLYPERQFVLVGGGLNMDNVSSLSFRDEEGAFLAGVTAAQESVRGGIGFLVGQGEANLEVAFRAGVRSVSPRARVIVAIQEDEDNGDPVEVLQNQFGMGIDVVFLGPGVKEEPWLNMIKEEPGPGLILFTLSPKGWDQVEGILVSLEKRVEEVVEEVALAGDYPMGTVSFGIEEGAITIELDDIDDPELSSTLRYFRGRITSGLLRVPTTEEELEEFIENSL